MALVLVALLLAACSEERSGGDDRDGEAATAGQIDPGGGTCDDPDLLVCARASTIGDLVPDAPEVATGEPITVGMVNQENTPGGSFPEMSRATAAFVSFVNEQLGGVDGRPIRLEVCDTGFSAEGSAACGQRFAEQGVPAVLGGIDVFGNAVDVLGESGIPYVGGIPISIPSMTAPTSFQFSGGIWGAAEAFARHATDELGARSVAIVYGDFGSVADAARGAESTLRDRGVEVAMVPFPVVSTDMGAPMQAAWSNRPDAVFVLTADTGCAAAFDAAATIGITAPTFYTGACAAPSVIERVGDRADGAFFNVEQEVRADADQSDTDLYTSVLAAEDPDLQPIGAGTVAAKSFVNLYSILRQLGGDGISPEAISAALRAQRDAPSFMGHPYTCDGRQFPDLPAACSPQQVIVELDDGELRQVSDWISVDR